MKDRKENMILSESERKLVRLVKAIDNSRDFVIPVCIAAREDGTTDEIISFIESNPGIDQDTLARFVFGSEPLEIVDEE